MCIRQGRTPRSRVFFRSLLRPRQLRATTTTRIRLVARWPIRQRCLRRCTEGATRRSESNGAQKHRVVSQRCYYLVPAVPRVALAFPRTRVLEAPAASAPATQTTGTATYDNTGHLNARGRVLGFDNCTKAERHATGTEADTRRQQAVIQSRVTLLRTSSRERSRPPGLASCCTRRTLIGA